MLDAVGHSLLRLESGPLQPKAGLKHVVGWERGRAGQQRRYCQRRSSAPITRCTAPMHSVRPASAQSWHKWRLCDLGQAAPGDQGKTYWWRHRPPRPNSPAPYRLQAALVRLRTGTRCAHHSGPTQGWRGQQLLAQVHPCPSILSFRLQKRRFRARVGAFLRFLEQDVTSHRYHRRTVVLQCPTGGPELHRKQVGSTLLTLCSLLTLSSTHLAQSYEEVLPCCAACTGAELPPCAARPAQQAPRPPWRPEAVRLLAALAARERGHVCLQQAAVPGGRCCPRLRAQRCVIPALLTQTRGCVLCLHCVHPTSIEQDG